MASLLYTAVKACNPETRADWAGYVAWSGLTQLREVVSLDTLLCPNVFKKLPTLADEDWKHNVHADLKTHLFYDLDYVLRRVAGQAVTVLGLLEDPTADDVASVRDPRLDFSGFDLVEEDGGGISALTNCSGFEKAYARAELSECGLLVDHARAVAVRDLLRSKYPDEPHARCRIWAIWKAKP